jgi:hypothetical protein
MAPKCRPTGSPHGSILHYLSVAGGADWLPAEICMLSAHVWDTVEAQSAGY